MHFSSALIMRRSQDGTKVNNSFISFNALFQTALERASKAKAREKLVEHQLEQENLPSMI